MENNRNEVDLIEAIVKFYLYLKKYYLILIISLVAGIIFSFVKTKIQDPVYSSSMIIESKADSDFLYAISLNEEENEVRQNHGQIIVELINSLNSLRINENIETLIKKTKLTTEQIRPLISVEAFYKYKKDEPENNLVTVIAASSSPETFKYLGQGIINFINTNDYIHSKYTSDSVYLSNVIKNIDLKIGQLNENKGNINLPKIGKDKISDPLIESVKLFSLKEKLLNEMKKLNKSKIIEDFYIPVINKNIKRTFILNTILFLLAGILTIIFLIIHRKSKNISQKQLH